MSFWQCIILIVNCIIVNALNNVCELKKEGEIVDCSGNGLIDVPLDYFPSNVKQIRIQGNQINELNVNVFVGLAFLEYLDLSNNNLTELPIHIFASIPQLKVLKLRKNRFTTLPLAIQSFIALDRLDLRNNRIQNLTENDIRLLANIEQVDLGKNLIEIWPNQQILPTNNRLTTLNLANNKLISLHNNQFSSLQNLQSLKLSKNRIKYLESDNFDGLGQLKSLDLSRNQLHTITALQFNSLNSLKSLNLAQNQLKSVQPGAFYGIDSLHRLNLSSNRLDFSGISDGGFYGLNELEELDLSKNRLSKLSTQLWHYTPELKKLWLNNNQLKQLIGNEFHLSRLEFLSLASNQMDSIQVGTLNSLGSLVELDLSNNNLAIFVEDKSNLRNLSLPSVKRLIFSSNNLKFLRANAFNQFPGLNELDLRKNPISTMLADSFNELRLKELLIGTNELRCDCNLKWFIEWMFENSIDTSDIKAECLSPSNLNRQNLMDISIEDLICSAADSPIVRLIKHPQTLIKALVGSNTQIICSGYGAAPLELEWKIFKDGCAIGLDENDLKFKKPTNHTLNEDGNEYIYGTLEIFDLEIDDSNDYQCSIKNAHGSIYSDPIHLIVQKIPEFLSIPKDVMAIEGSNILLECSAYGNPDPIISWHKDSRLDFPAAAERRLHIKDSEDGVYLLNVSKRDEGIYTCHATSDAGHVYSQARVQILDKVFKNEMESKVIYPHSTSTFDCSTHFPFDLKWLWNERIPLNESNLDIQFSNNGEFLTIYWTESLTNGQITCELYINGQFLTKKSVNLFTNPISFIKEADSKMVIRSPLEKRQQISTSKQIPTNSIIFGILLGLTLGILIGVTVILTVCLIRCYCKSDGNDELASNESERPLNEKSSTL